MTNIQGIFCPYWSGALVPSTCLAGFAPSYLTNNGTIQGECATCSGIPGITLNGWSQPNSTCCTSASFAAVVEPENGKFLGCAAGFIVRDNESCEACKGGTFSVGGTKRTCTTCEVTKLSPGFGYCSTSNGSVTSCIGPGFYKTPEKSCKVCDQGTYSSSGISDSCNNCNGTGICDPANGESNVETQTRICPPGTYVSSESTCVLCSNNTFSSVSNNGSSCTSLCPANSQCNPTGGIKSCNSNAHFNHKTNFCDLNLELLSIIPTITALQIIPSATSSTTTTTTLLVKVTQSAALQLGAVFNTFVSEVYNVITLIKAKTN